jgi:hypothetical protein
MGDSLRRYGVDLAADLAVAIGEARSRAQTEQLLAETRELKVQTQELISATKKRAQADSRSADDEQRVTVMLWDPKKYPRLKRRQVESALKRSASTVYRLAEDGKIKKFGTGQYSTLSVLKYLLSKEND